MFSKLPMCVVCVGSRAASNKLLGLCSVNKGPALGGRSRTIVMSAYLQKDETDAKRHLQTQPENTHSNDSRAVIEEAMTNVQGLQGDPVHYFTPPYSRDVMSQMHETPQDRFDSINQGMPTNPSECSYSHYTRAQEMVSPDSYQHSSHVSLYSVMQSNVPHPYDQGPTHLNMPSGGHSQQQKYISGMLNDTHPSRNFGTSATSRSGGKQEVGTKNGAQMESGPSQTGSGVGEGDKSKQVKQTVRLRQAVKDYGGTVVVFHVAISLASLGGFYIAVTSGLDVVAVLRYLGVGESILESRLAAGASTFVVAYAVHKVFAPVRIAMTLTCTPFIVRHLRRIGFLKPPKVT